MKKIVFICSLLLSITALSMNGLNFTAANTADVTENTVELESVLGFEIVFEYSDTCDMMGSCCTAVVYYQGHYHTHFTCCGTYMDCACAYYQACEYIQSQGGTCPIGY